MPEEFWRFYKKPLQVEVDVRSLSIDRRRSTARSGSINRREWTRLREVLWPTHLRSPLPCLHGNHQVSNLVAAVMFHVHTVKNLFSSPADDWIVIAKQHCVCALRDLRNERLEKGSTHGSGCKW